MKKSRFVIVCMLIFILCAAFAGCSREVSLQKYVDKNKDKVISQVNASFGNIFDFDFFVRDNAVVYSYKYKSITKDNVDSAALDKALDAQSSVFQNIIDQMKDSGIKSPSVLVEYLDSKGDLILSKEFK